VTRHALTTTQPGKLDAYPVEQPVCTYLRNIFGTALTLYRSPVAWKVEAAVSAVEQLRQREEEPVASDTVVDD